MNKAAAIHKRDFSLSAHLTHTFGSFPLTSVCPSMLADYKTQRRQEGAAPKTINDELKLLGHAYKLAAMEWEWVTENPVQKVSREKVRNLALSPKRGEPTETVKGGGEVKAVTGGPEGAQRRNDSGFQDASDGGGPLA